MRITALSIQTPDLDRATAYYGTTLGLPLISQEAEQATFRVGWSRFTLEQATEPLPSVYHVAFGIRRGSFEPATAWLRERARLLQDAAGQTEFWFENWGARSIYWRDADGNILELIASDQYEPEPRPSFDAGSLLGVAEIGVAVEDVPAFVARVSASHDIRPFGPVDETFTTVGDDVYGQLIVVRSGRLWFPEQTSPALPLPTRIEVNNRLLI